MADLSLVLDLGGIQAAKEDMAQLEVALQGAAAKLAAQAHLHILEQTSVRLHTRRQKYLEALVKPVEIMKGVFVIVLEGKASWIEEGRPQGSMVDDLLRKSPYGNAKGGPKTAKDGSTYRVIPFEHSKGPTKSSPAEQTLTAALKKELKNLKIPWGKIERNQDGTPKSGLLHSFDGKGQPQMPTPDRPSHAQSTPNKGNDPFKPPNQHGYGQGRIEAAMQGPTGIPLLKGLRIYQTPLFSKDGKPALDKKGLQKATKSVVTFRIVSSKHRGVKWEHPGLEGMLFFDEALKWATNEWETKMLPEILAKVGITV